MKLLLSLFIILLFTVMVFAGESTVQTPVDSFRVNLVKTDDTPTVLIDETLSLKGFDKKIAECDRDLEREAATITSANAAIVKKQAVKDYWIAQKTEAEKSIIEVPDFNLTQ